MNEQAIIRQIANLSVAEAKTSLQRIHQMQDHLNAIRSGEVKARQEWLNSSELIFLEDFTEEMNKLSSDLHPIESLLKQLDRIEAALKGQLEKLKAR
jgi:hypothetical protein